MLHKAHSTEYFMPPLKSSSWSAPTKCPLTVRLPDPTPPSAFKAHGPALSAYPLRRCPTSSGRAPIPESR